ncbi:hypothetical protein PIROE2DRAFT_1470 [Piromyces sp. E2]|nr:hypothetical protein PIROE2DRAFT_1470 [Piromyces sp. E2]|eukprot:OUM70336.1 hypothetical protein PIROE2DRAFT_1470 [Piromyces sp. E2]
MGPVINDYNISHLYYLVEALDKKDINNNIELLDIIFDTIAFYDKEFILNLLFYYKNKITLSTIDLKPQISKYKISREKDQNCSSENIGSSIYLFQPCYDGKIELIRYLIEHGVNTDIYNKLQETPLTISSNINFGIKATPVYEAYTNGHENIVKYLVKQGADINKSKTLTETP